MTPLAMRTAPKSCLEKPHGNAVKLLRHVRQAHRPLRCSRRCPISVRAAAFEPEGGRRELIFAAAAATVALPRVAAAEGDKKTLFGLASPPTSYGGYGGNAKESAKYTYDYPSTWKQETVGKQEKGMVGIDSRVRNPRLKTETAFTITFGRAGEDNKRFKLGDVESTLQGFAGADYDLQDALTSATFKKSGKRDKDGQEFYDYEVFSKDINFLVSVSLKSGKVYALFVKAPTKVFKTDEQALREIIGTFQIL